MNTASVDPQPRFPQIDDLVAIVLTIQDEAHREVDRPLVDLDDIHEQAQDSDPANWSYEKWNSLGISGPITVQSPAQETGEIPITFTHLGSFTLLFLGDQAQTFTTLLGPFAINKQQTSTTGQVASTTSILTTASTTSSASASRASSETSQPSDSNSNAVHDQGDISASSASQSSSTTGSASVTLSTTPSSSAPGATNSNHTQIADSTSGVFFDVPLVLICIFSGLLFLIILLILSYCIWRRRAKRAQSVTFRGSMMVGGNKFNDRDSDFEESRMSNFRESSFRETSKLSYHTSPRSSFDKSSSFSDDASPSVILPTLAKNNSLPPPSNSRRTSVYSKNTHSSKESVPSFIKTYITDRQMFLRRQITRLRQKLLDITNSHPDSESELSGDLREDIRRLEALQDSHWALESTDCPISR
ncbi:hypothetical protein K435DRAFT_863851 [Dendrothele bispora CBS 962.96]|uniref:Mid2 domain-containing protein n=1 Tax=Dendrothele bispora (strain CBS 962.96) TaxID=1314807 RepID=A0A4S8LNR2_DENBC|nr:hypothetical protein K435DRAFT_863851 [Dendrothele bispora CBS 962.96]